MGGQCSGRWRRHWPKLLVEDSLVLDIDQLVRDGILRPPSPRAGQLTWTDTAGEAVATVAYEVRWTGQRSGVLRLRFTATDLATGEAAGHDEEVALTATTPPFGGLRWWFRCPATNEQAHKLYLPPGAERFASRVAHRLGYATQRQHGTGRAEAKLEAIRRRLGADPNRLIWLAPRPKGMHWRIFMRLRAEGHAAELATLEAFVASIAPFDPDEAKRADRSLEPLRRLAAPATKWMP